MNCQGSDGCEIGATFSGNPDSRDLSIDTCLKEPDINICSWELLNIDACGFHKPPVEVRSEKRLATTIPTKPFLDDNLLCCAAGSDCKKSNYRLQLYTHLSIRLWMRWWRTNLHNGLFNCRSRL